MCVCVCVREMFIKTGEKINPFGTTYAQRADDSKQCMCSSRYTQRLSPESGRQIIKNIVGTAADTRVP